MERLRRLYGDAEPTTPADADPPTEQAPMEQATTAMGPVEPESEGSPEPGWQPGPGQYHVAAPGTGAPAPPPPVDPGGRRPAPAAGPTPPAPPAPVARRKAPRPRRFRPKWRWLYLYLPLLLLGLVVLGAIWAVLQFRSLERIDLEDSLAVPTGDTLNYLLVGSDSRENVDADTPNAGAIGTDVTGRRADTIIVLRVEPAKATMMSIPRDLWVTDAETGEEGRINGSYNRGPPNLVRTITQNLGIPIHHYVEVDFVSFAGMVDAMGGVVIDFEHPAFDSQSGLSVEGSGPQTLDGTQALAYVRSRAYTEVIDGEPVTDPTADLGRQERQQQFIRTVLAEVGETRNPVTAVRVVGAATEGVRVDDTFGLGDAWSLVRKLGGSDPETVVLPTTPARKGGAAVLVLDEAAAAPVLAEFGAQ